MAAFREEELVTLTIVRSEIAQQASGATALILHTQEQDAIALALSLESIEILRKELNKAEVILRRPHGTA